MGYNEKQMTFLYYVCSAPKNYHKLCFRVEQQASRLDIATKHVKIHFNAGTTHKHSPAILPQMRGAFEGNMHIKNLQLKFSNDLEQIW